MRVMFAVGGGSSHLYPLVPLAWAFRAAGHEVRLVGKPKEAEVMKRTGLPTVTLGGPPQLPPGGWDEVVEATYDHEKPWPLDWPARPEALDERQRWALEALGRYSIAVSAGMAEDVLAFARQWRVDLVIYEIMCLGVTALTDIPCVRNTHGTQDLYRLECRADGEPLPEYAALLDRFGAEPPPAGPLPYVDTMPPSMYIGGEQPCVSLRWVPYNGTGVMPDGLSGPRRRPRVCVTWGVSIPRAFGSNAADPYRTAITSLLDAGAEVVVMSSKEQLETLGEPAAGVRHLAGVPLNLVLPYCDAVVHHGGQGTTMAAVSVGIPQLAITREPLSANEHERLALTGAGLHFRARDLENDPDSAATIREALDKLLSDPHFADGAARLRADDETLPTPAEAAATLAELAGVVH